MANARRCVSLTNGKRTSIKRLIAIAVKVNGGIHMLTPLKWNFINFYYGKASNKQTAKKGTVEHKNCPNTPVK